MSEETTEQENPKPICPHCGEDPYNPAMIPLSAGNIRLIVFFCATCRKVTGQMLLPMERRIAPPGPTIVKP